MKWAGIFLEPTMGMEPTFNVQFEDGERSFVIVGPAHDSPCRAERLAYRMPVASHDAYLAFHSAVACRFGTRYPRGHTVPTDCRFEAKFQPLLTRNLSSRVMYGYGDPAIILVREAPNIKPVYYAVVTSNDAPDAFPILRAETLKDWSLVGFVFPCDNKPAWALDGPESSDFWAPEMHCVGGEFRVYFAARERDSGKFAIGMARAAGPRGPFVAEEKPLLRGNVIDPHVLAVSDNEVYLLWKQDANDIWPMDLVELLHSEPTLVGKLFTTPEDQRTAAFAQSLRPWLATRGAMERFLALQPMIEAVTADYAAFRKRLYQYREHVGDTATHDLAGEILDAMTTPVYAQRLSSDGSHLQDARHVVLKNDQPWEAHLVEGIWVARHGQRFYMFYAANDFSTSEYGIGVAIADAPLGPYRKMELPLVQSTAQWMGPGHPSVAPGPEGQALLFLHAFFPGEVGYKRFRALLALPIMFQPDAVVLC